MRKTLALWCPYQESNAYHQCVTLNDEGLMGKQGNIDDALDFGGPFKHDILDCRRGEAAAGGVHKSSVSSTVSKPPWSTV